MRRAFPVVALLLGLSSLVHASELAKQGSVSILVLTGSAHERGVAHGKLLAPEILANAGALAKLQGERVPDETVFLGLLEKFTWSEDESAELDGIVDGVRAKLGEDVKVPGTARRFARRDVVGINTIADLLPLACSSFTITGKRVEGGGTITARNLDYPVLGTVIEQRLLIVHAARESEHAWATIGWAGAIGCYTGMNADGVTASIHDVPTNPGFLLGQGFTPRSIGLRRILERTAPDGFAESAAKVLQGCPVAYGNNIHVSAPGSAVVLEWDPDRTKGRGVTIREAKDGAIVCTNHWRSRREPEKCRRFEALSKALADRTRPLAPKEALATLGLAAVSGKDDLTIHSAVFSLEQRRLLVAFARDEQHPAPGEEPVDIDLGALFARSAKRWW